VPPDFALSTHAQDMLNERRISESWVWSTITEPDDVWEGQDGNTHYAKVIVERGSRVLHIVVNQNATPQRIVTAFFDRRLKKKEPGQPNETQN
jgi:hypothetical protein